METRSIISKVEHSGRVLQGYAAVFNSPTTINENGRTFSEVIRQGAFRKAIEGKTDVVATFNHDVNQLLGRTSSGTLRIMEDTHGLRFELDLPDHATAVREMVQRGDLKGASFTFNVNANGQKWDGNTRELTDVTLFELGPVAMPAYGLTELSLRSNLDLYKIKLKCLEKLTRGT